MVNNSVRSGVATSKLDDCLCAFADLLGGAKADIVTLIDSLIATLEALKALLLLFMVDFEDELKKLEYQAELAVIEAAVGYIEAPFNLILGYTRVLADCDPVASFADTLKKTRDEVLSDFYERQYEVEQLISALNAKSKEIEELDRKIEMLKEFRDSIELCGEE